ncbi:MAG: Hpt domain-containing protein [Clostridia bacterium]|nr:Hpt domain-containing protein [Clostridia bacterium]
MMTLEALQAYGADTEAGLARCMGMKDFYLRLVKMELADGNFDALATALNAGDMKAAFEAAHALKGAVGNLALTPLYTPIYEITELLRHADAPIDTGDLLPRIQQALADLRALEA